ncbi:MAG TPA: hypothetical protein VG604_05170 [Candidatus Saccharimonadales bacterium]|nr:hypothetical protein [Candidatus Saccharimonadales bacterium]
MKLNRKGFGGIEIILAIALLIGLAVVGYSVYKTNQDNKKVDTSKVSSQQSQNSSSSSALEKQASKDIKGYDTLPADFKPLILAQLQKVIDGCNSRSNAKTEGATAGMVVDKVVGNQFISLNEQQTDCQGGAETYYSKVGGAWQYDFIATQAPSCDLVNKYHYTKQIIPDCYPDGASAAIANTNP